MNRLHKLTELEIEMERRPGLYSTNPPAKKKWVTKEDILTEFHKSREVGQITDEFVRLLMLMARRIANNRNYNQYRYYDELIDNAMRHLVERQMCMTYQPECSDNPFGYYTQIIKNAFAQTTCHQKKLSLMERGYPDRTMICLYERAMEVVNGQT